MTNKFVNRQKELEPVDRILQDLERMHLLAHPLVQYYGPPGIGKTWLLEEIQRKCEDWRKSLQSPEKRMGHRAVFVIPITVPEEGKFTAHDMARKIFGMVQVRKGSRTLQDSLDEVADAFGRSVPWQVTLPAFVKYINGLLNESTQLILLIDQFDLTSEGTRADILGLFKDLDPGWVAFLFSRYPVDLVDLSSQAQMVELKPFDAQSSQEQFAREEKALFIEKVLDITLGLPLANDAALSFLRAASLTTEQLSEEQERSLIDTLYEKVIRERALQYIRDDEQKKQFERVLQVLAIPRTFNLSTMKGLVEAFASPYKQASADRYLYMLERLKRETGIIMTRDFQYTIRDPFRGILSRKWQMDNPQDYARAHQLLGEKYEQLIGVMATEDARLLSPLVLEYVYNVALGPGTSVREPYSHMMRLLKTQSPHQFPRLIQLVTQRLGTDPDLRIVLDRQRDDIEAVHKNLEMATA